ncbi:MAG TPA: FUSC family protein [Lacunisphaera sp.]
MNALIARTRDYLERNRLQPDLNRAARSTVAFMVPILAAQWWQLPIEASFAAIAAQNVAQVDVRGSYPLRLSLLLAMTAILAGATWLGGITGTDLPLALCAVILLMVLSGVWRHLSSEYGPSLGIASMLLFLIALDHPGNANVADRHFLAALTGGILGLLVQGALWPFRAQHPLRRVVADGWTALSDLLAAMAPGEMSAMAARHQLIAEQQAALRTALDQATATLAAAPSHDKRPYLRQLEELNLAAARFATRFMAVNASLETLMVRPDFEMWAPSFDPVIASLANSTRTVALTVVSRQPSHLAACEVRLRRLGTLLEALREQVLTQTDHSPEGVQLAFLLRQIENLLPGVEAAVRATIERGDERSAFSLELFDLQTWSLRPLASALNFHWRPDPVLVRFIARGIVLQLAGVTAFKLFAIERGYWLPWTMLVVLQPEFGATRIRAGQRVFGTLAGGVAASLLLWLSLPPAVLLSAMAVTVALFSFWLKRNYAISVFFITIFVVLITEISTHVTIAFTLERLGATAAGGVLALAAAFLFWPVWERQRLPGLLATAFRANRKYILTIGRRLTAGGAYDAEVIAAKRVAELANGMIFASLKRMSADPKSQQNRLAGAATLANGNQRLTQAFTAIALHLAAGSAVTRPEIIAQVDRIAEAFELLAIGTEATQPDTGKLAAMRQSLVRSIPRASKGSPVGSLEQVVCGQFGRCTTELGAMLIAAAGDSAPDENERGAGLPIAAS